MYMGLPMKPMMYKIGTGVNDNTIAGKIYNERRGDKDGDIMWAHLQGKLYARRANESEAGMVNMYDAQTLSPLGEAKLQCGDIFSGAGPC
jgi:hypothetical protein